MKTGRQFGWSIGLGAGLLVLFVASILVPVSSTYALNPTNMVAGTQGSARLVWEENSIYGSPVPFWPWDVQVSVLSGRQRVSLIGKAARRSGAARLELAFIPKGPSGDVVLQIDTGVCKKKFRLRLTGGAEDVDEDGFPDMAELWDDGDRLAFRRWFVAIAESQFYSVDNRWARVNRDCAGLARFAYMQAMRRHDAAWLSATSYLHHWPGKDVQAFSYPDVPVLGQSLFRTRPGSFDGVGSFLPTASARVLWELNTVFVSRQECNAQMGDLLFFRDIQNADSPMHTMILLDPPGAGMKRRVVYHTGAEGDDPGEVRMVSLADLSAHKDDRWHPQKDNPNFLGFYRWKILDGGQP